VAEKLEANPALVSALPSANAPVEPVKQGPVFWVVAVLAMYALDHLISC